MDKKYLNEHETQMLGYPEHQTKPSSAEVTPVCVRCDQPKWAHTDYCGMKRCPVAVMTYKPKDQSTAALQDELQEMRLELITSHGQTQTALEDKAALQAERDALNEKYGQLIYSVSMKFPDESRHETALRYIRQAEQSRGPAAAAKNPDAAALKGQS